MTDPYENAGQSFDEDKAAELAYAQSQGVEFVPMEIADRLAAGENPIRIWRTYRGLTLAQLASAAGLSTGHLSEIERDIKDGTIWVYRELARALGVDIDDLA